MNASLSPMVTLTLQVPPPHGSLLPSSGQHTGVHVLSIHNSPLAQKLSSVQLSPLPFKPPMCVTHAVVKAAAPPPWPCVAMSHHWPAGQS